MAERTQTDPKLHLGGGYMGADAEEIELITASTWLSKFTQPKPKERLCAENGSVASNQEGGDSR